MTGLFNLTRAGIRRGWAYFRVHLDDTINIFRYAYLGTLLGTLLVLVPVLIVAGLMKTASAICFFDTVLLSILGHLFNARLLLSVGIYKSLRRLTRMRFQGQVVVDTADGTRLVDDRPYLGKLQYWDSFVNMWPPMVTFIVGLLLLFESGWELGVLLTLLIYVMTLAIAMLIIWAVATQTEFGQFWRKVHIATTMTMFATLLIGIFTYGWFLGTLHEHHRNQKRSLAEDRYRGLEHSRLQPVIENDNTELAEVHELIAKELHDGNTPSAALMARQSRLEASKKYADSQIEQHTNSARAIAAVNTKASLGPFKLLLGILGLGLIVMALSKLGAFEESSPEHSR